jgi:DNA helicase HerA-like ATPase
MNQTISEGRIFLGQGESPVHMLPKMGNRHGIIAGATGTGKTVTLQVLAEGFSRLGVPVFMADVKGDLSGMCAPGGGKPKLEERAQQIGLADYAYLGFPVTYWDLYGKQGHPVRTTISEMGPLLLSRLLNLNEIQEGVLNLTFKLADDEGLLLLDLKDLRAMLVHVADNAAELTKEYGNVSATSVGAIQRNLLVLEQQGADQFFGEPALQLTDLMTRAPDGRGTINILAADQLMSNPRLYSTFLLWLLAELFEDLPEIGDPEQPKLVFFFDEAHLLFSDAPRALVEKIEQVVRLIRSKGVGVYFISQNPLDVPDSVLGQLGNRVQHALRAYTPRDQKAVETAASTFRVNPKFKTNEAITQLGVGEALVSVLDEKGIPTVVERALIRPPSSRLGPATPEERQAVIASSTVGAKYNQTFDRDSAYERLKRAAEAAAPAPPPPVREYRAPQYERPRPEPAPRKPAARRSDTAFEAATKSVLRSAGSQLGRSLVRGVLGSIFKKR